MYILPFTTTELIPRKLMEYNPRPMQKLNEIPIIVKGSFYWVGELVNFIHNCAWHLDLFIGWYEIDYFLINMFKDGSILLI